MGSLATSALIGGQAIYARRRRDLPTVVGGDASGTEGDPSLPTVVVGCAGDSTLTGPGLDHPEQTWVRVAARRVAHERHVVIRSFAAGGSGVSDVLDHQLEPLLDTQPDVAVVAVGSNDVLRFTPLGALDTSFRILVTALSEQVPRVVVGGVGDLGAIARVPSPLSALLTLRSRSVDRIIRRACERRANVRYVDVSCTDGAFRRGGRRLFTPDLFHPNHYGHEIWAGVAGPVVAHAIRSVTPRTINNG
ncbi:MAG TPA: GDSL-type esterase/lipase family protein [Acidimicrobiales bacterium]